ncbi:MAG TPA: hypothetical protein VEF72_09405 [Mycobacterium sp.]|nr:hypothetical protein [Mycobacterium sp.]
MTSSLSAATMRPAQRAEEEPGNPTQRGDDAARAAGRGGAPGDPWAWTASAGPVRREGEPT